MSLGSNGAGGNGSSTSGGSGGAGGPGSPNSGAGGPGVTLTITGSSVTYAAGSPGVSNYADYGPGAANTGNGGGGTGQFTYTAENSGGSGIVVIAYPDTFGAATCTGTYDEPTRTGYRVYRFTGSGTITFPAS